MLILTAPDSADPPARVGMHAGDATALAAYRDAVAAARTAPARGGVVLTREAVTVVVAGELPGLGLPLAPATYADVRRLLDGLAAAATRWSHHGGLMPCPGDDAVALLAALATELATAAGHVVLEPLPDARWAYHLAAGWSDPSADAAETAWSLAAAAELERYDLGVTLPGLPSLRDRSRLAA